MTISYFMNTLDDVIKECQEKYVLGVTERNRSKYVAFLQRQLKAHPDYNLNFRTEATKNPFPYFNLIVDKLLLFSYLIGETPIIAGYKEHTEVKRIKSIRDLYLLRPAEMGYGRRASKSALMRRTDRRLFDLCHRFYNKKNIFKSQNWGEAIDELGRDIVVIRHFGQKITYDMVKSCPSPNPLTYGHGGYRWGTRKS